MLIASVRGFASNAVTTTDLDMDEVASHKLAAAAKRQAGDAVLEEEEEEADADDAFASGFDESAPAPEAAPA